MAGTSKDVDLPPIEEKRLVDLNLDLLSLMAGSRPQENAMSEEEDDTQTLEKNSRY